ncbi:MAG: MerR family transcriptional regulator [Desulfobacteraceae bacterium]|nr:MerR family transcriptional regulator [Desulfobacteraceae bacterium]
MGGYTKKEVAELTALTPRLVQFYTERGVVKPHVDDGSGRGKVRRYSTNNLIEFGVIRQLVEFGITVSKISDILNLLREIKPNRPVKRTWDGSGQHTGEIAGVDGDFKKDWSGTRNAYIAIFPDEEKGYRHRMSWGESPKHALLGLSEMFLSTQGAAESLLIIDFGRILKKFTTI